VDPPDQHTGIAGGARAAAGDRGDRPVGDLVDGVLLAADIASIEAAAEQELSDAVAFAEAGTWEDVDDLERDVLTPIPEAAQ